MASTSIPVKSDPNNAAHAHNTAQKSFDTTAIKADPAHIVIVGAGPAGLLLAFYLLERGGQRFRVSIYEAREDLRVTAMRELNARRYSLVLSYRGKKVLKKIPGLLEAIQEISLPSTDLYLHVGKYSGKRAFVLKGAAGANADEIAGLAVDRADLCAKILDRLLERHGTTGRLQIHFFKKCAGVDFDAREALFEDVQVNVEAQGNDVTVLPGQDTRQATTGAPPQKVPYDLLVGADGVNSAVRHSLTLLPRGFDCEVTDQFARAFILHVPRPACIQPAGFNIVPSIPDAQSFRCLFYPNGRKAETVNLALIWPVHDPPVELLAMKDPGEMTSWLRKRLPFLELPESAARDMLSQRVTALRMVKCEPYHLPEGRTVLIGDAAHATPPAIGQGCNSSLVDAAVLARLLLGEAVGEDDRLELKEKKAPGDAVGEGDRSDLKDRKAPEEDSTGREEFLKRLPAALAKYSALQVPEGHALVDLSESEGPLDSRVGFWQAVRRFATGILSKLFPWIVSPPVMFMAGLGANFSDIRRLHAAEVDKILASNARVKAQWRDQQAKKVLAQGV